MSEEIVRQRDERIKMLEDEQLKMGNATKNFHDAI